MDKAAIFASARSLKSKPMSLSTQIESCRKAAADAGYLVSEEFTDVESLLRASTDKTCEFEKVFICYPECSLWNSAKLPKITKQLELNGKQIQLTYSPKFKSAIQQAFRALADEGTPRRSEGDVR